MHPDDVVQTIFVVSVYNGSPLPRVRQPGSINPRARNKLAYAYLHGDAASGEGVRNQGVVKSNIHEIQWDWSGNVS